MTLYTCETSNNFDFVNNFVHPIHLVVHYELIIHEVEHMHIVYNGYHIQAAENHRKECHRFWLCLRHAVILILNV